MGDDDPVTVPVIRSEAYAVYIAIRKLKTMLQRGECQHRYEVERLIQTEKHFQDLLSIKGDD